MATRKFWTIEERYFYLKAELDNLLIMSKDLDENNFFIIIKEIERILKEVKEN